MSQNVKFFFTSTKAKYDALLEKNPLALYFITDEATDCNYLYKGDELIAVGHEASEQYAGLMSAADKAKLDALTVGGINGLVPVDGTISIADTEDGGKAIGVAISKQEGNALSVVEGGLFVPHAKEVVVPEYAIEKQETATEGFLATYKLKKTTGEEVTYVGDEINIGKDMVLQGATLETVSEADVPYDGAVVGDPYIDMAFNDESKSHIYVPVKGLVDIYSAGNGIEIVDNTIFVKIAPESHGLVAVDGGALSLVLASAEHDGAMSKEDKAFIDSISEIYASKEFVKNTAEQTKYEITGVPTGTLINYREDEIRVMCPADATYTKQAVGAGGDSNTYYMTFKTYAPSDDAVGYIEHLNGQADAEILTNFSVDKYGRRYQPTWLGIAKLDEATGAWTYYGASSTEDKYIGWDYQIDWYNADGVMIASDCIRISLSNEDCHNVSTPYYLNNYVTVEQIEEIEQSMSWGEL